MTTPIKLLQHGIGQHHHIHYDECADLPSHSSPIKRSRQLKLWANAIETGIVCKTRNTVYKFGYKFQLLWTQCSNMYCLWTTSCMC